MRRTNGKNGRSLAYRIGTRLDNEFSFSPDRYSLMQKFLIVILEHTDAQMNQISSITVSCCSPCFEGYIYRMNNIHQKTRRRKKMNRSRI